MYRRRITFAGLAALLISLLAAGLAGNASAGGPTSVILVAPGTGRTASLYTGSADYEALSRLLETDQNGQAPPDASPGTGEPSGVTITWLIHDVQVWRVDEVDLSGQGGPWISTRQDIGGTTIWDAPIQRHRASDRAALMALLARLGLTPAGPGSSPGPSSEPVAGRPVTAADRASAAPRTAAPETAAGTAAPGTAGAPGAAGRWSWGAAGLMLGSALTLGGIRLGRRRPAHPRAEPAMATGAAEVLDTSARAGTSP